MLHGKTENSNGDSYTFKEKEQGLTAVLKNSRKHHSEELLVCLLAKLTLILSAGGRGAHLQWRGFPL